MSLQLQHLREKIGTARTLLGVVETMHGLAAVNIRRAEAAADQARRYARTVHLALYAALDGSRGREGHDADGAPTILILTTDMGLCGQFNERIVSYGLELERRLRRARPTEGLGEAGSGPGEPDARWIVVGLRGLERLHDEGVRIVATLDAPGSVEAIPGAVAQAFGTLQSVLGTPHPGPLYVVHNGPAGGTAFAGRRVRLFPFEPTRWARLPDGEGPWRAPPLTAPGPDELLPRLLREQIYIDLYQAFVESFAAENAARLASMKHATDNIDELLEDLQSRYRRERQDVITTELMELLSGVEAVRHEDASRRPRDPSAASPKENGGNRWESNPPRTGQPAPRRF